MAKPHIFATALALVLCSLSLTACAGLADIRPTGEPAQGAPKPTTSSPAPTESPTPATPLLTISAIASDVDGNSMKVTMVLDRVAPLTSTDRAELTRCTSPEILDAANTSVAYVSVTAEGLDGFSGWTGDRGIVFNGDRFDGTMWTTPAHGGDPTCIPGSMLSTPGTGHIRSLASTLGWPVDAGLSPLATATFGLYGFSAQTHNANGQLTGMSDLASCLTVPSTEFEATALAAYPHRWGGAQNLASYCYYGRNAGD